MASLYRRTMDALYAACAAIAGIAMVVIALIISWGVFTRYVLNQASSWPEPLATLLAVVLTFFGAAACYRLGLHMRVSVVPNMLAPLAQRLCNVMGELVVGGVSVYMILWGWDLVQTTWDQSIPDFPGLSVGLTYLPIPVGGVCTVLFIVERLLIGAKPPQSSHPTVETTVQTAAFE